MAKGSPPWWVIVFLIGCSSLPKSFTATPSHALPFNEKTTLGDLLQKKPGTAPGQSGFALMNTGKQALLTRLGLADVAEKTIDAQYFIWAGDDSGLLLMDRLIKAADRGVRVRLLLDDMTSHGKDLGLAVLNQHPRIEVRVFNPLGRRYYIGLFRSLSVAFNVGRMTNRMHNKIFVVDNQGALVGGRNIADEYFGVDKKSNFRDMDLFAAGPIVPEISQAFDDYWNSPWSIPFEVFKTKIPSDKAKDRLYAKLKKGFREAEKDFPYPLDWRRDTVIEQIKKGRDTLVWAPAEVISDAPDKAFKKAERGESRSEILNRLGGVMGQAKSEVVIVSPYLILSKETAQKFSFLTQQGVSVKILTNSLESTDALPVVAMYRPIRKDLLHAGVDLYEMRPDAASRKIYIDPSRTKSRMSLHAKNVVLDRRDVFVGTFNVDPRSEYLNTEVGLLVHSEVLASQILSVLGDDLLPSNSYRLGLEKEDHVVWHSNKEDGSPERHTSDPGAGVWRRFSAFFLSLLPISGQL